ncbi:MAG: Gfo/Idh/MocA family oxidoreductase [Acidobacteria bacterium]|nr:Gfo/Idh/MocA family oxidoreductase [Acidobacteriota bacterium]
MTEKPVPVGVVGVGALGRHHARVWAALEGARLVGVHDTDAARAEAVATEFGCPACPALDSLLAEVQAVSVAVPTASHHAVARQALEKGRDVLLEKPMTATLAEADELVELAERVGARLQVGHIERFNPATEELLAAVKAPRFIEVHRLGSFSPRSLDVDVVLDLMVHDLDIVLALDGSRPTQIEAVGIPVLTPKVDIANARLKFESGLIANVTASRVSLEKVRKFRVFAPRTYVSADFTAREAQIFRLEAPDGSDRPRISSEKRGAPAEEPLKRQIEAFLRSVKDRSEPVVPGADGRRALALAHAILARMAEA